MQKTIFVLLGACRWDIGSANAGYLEHLVEVGRAAKYQVRGELPSMSRPMYETLMTGLPVSVHGIVNNQVCRRSRHPNLFSLCRSQGLVTAAACYFWMSELYNGAPFDPLSQRFQLGGDGDIQHGIFYWEDLYPDSHLYADGEFLRHTYDPDFLLLHSMNIDYWGHQRGSDSREYAAAAGAAMEHLARLLPAWMDEGYQIVVTADHGMNALGHHGGPTWEQRTVPLYVISPLCVPGRYEEEEVSQLLIAPLVCRMLDLSRPQGMLRESSLPGLEAPGPRP